MVRRAADDRAGDASRGRNFRIADNTAMVVNARHAGDMRSPWPGWVRWAWLLPVLELVLSAAIAGPPAYRMLRNPPQLSRAANGKIVIDLRSPAVQQWLAE